MKRILPLLLLCTTSLFAQKAPFASQSDLVADLTDTLLGTVYHHRLGFDGCGYERSVWLQGLGNYRERDSSSERARYDDWFGGAVLGLNYGLGCDNYLNFYGGGTWGRIDIHGESNFDTESYFFGMSYERICGCTFFGFALAGGYLGEDRTYLNINEEPHGIFITPELTYACQLCQTCLAPIFTATLRYAGYFPRDYEHRETSGTLYVERRSIQLITLRGEAATDPYECYLCFQPYIGVSGRFQFDGNHVHGRLVNDRSNFSQGIDNSLAYGMIGLRVLKECARFDLQGSLEAGLDSDKSWKVFGELSLNYAF